VNLKRIEIEFDKFDDDGKFLTKKMFLQLYEQFDEYTFDKLDSNNDIVRLLKFLKKKNLF